MLNGTLEEVGGEMPTIAIIELEAVSAGFSSDLQPRIHGGQHCSEEIVAVVYAQKPVKFPHSVIDRVDLYPHGFCNFLFRRAVCQRLKNTEIESVECGIHKPRNFGSVLRYERTLERSPSR